MSELKIAVDADYHNIVPAGTYVGQLRKLGFEASWVTKPADLEMLRDAAQEMSDPKESRYSSSFVDKLSSLLFAPDHQRARLNTMKDADCVLVVNRSHLLLAHEDSRIKNNLSLQTIVTLSQAAALKRLPLLSDNFPFHTGEKRSPNIELDPLLQSMGARALNGNMEALHEAYEEWQLANRPGGTA